MSVLDPSSEEPTILPGAVYVGGPEFVGGNERAAVDALEGVGAIEVGKRDLGEIDGAAVRKRADDPALVVDRHRLQYAGRKAVLLECIDLHVAVGVGELSKSLNSELYVVHVGFGSVSRLSMTHIIASLAKPSAMRANAS